MITSGRAADAAFAEGFLAACAAHPALHETSHTHVRPLAHLGPPYGRAEGDVGLLLPSAGGTQRLLIVEREGSGPGNERSILKWYAALQYGVPIVLYAAGQTAAVGNVDIVLLLAFGRTPSFSANDYHKTVAYCRVITDLLTYAAPHLPVRLDVRVEAAPDLISDWHAYGHEVGARVLPELLS